MFSFRLLLFCLTCLLVKEFLLLLLLLFPFYSLFCCTFPSPTFPFIFILLCLLSLDNETLARLIDPSPSCIKKEIRFFSSPHRLVYIFPFLTEGNIISKHKHSLNSGGKFLLMPMFHLVLLQTKKKKKKRGRLYVGCFAYATVNVHCGSWVLHKQRDTRHRLVKTLLALQPYCKSQCGVDYCIFKTHHCAIMSTFSISFHST